MNLQTPALIYLLMLLSALLGLGLGIFSGLMPGIGSGSLLLITFPFLLQMDPIHALVLYISLVISSQYVASVTAIYTGIPGAESAAPTAKEFPTIRKLGLTEQAVFQNASVSVLGNVLGVVGFLLLTPYLFSLTGVYQNNVKVGILVLAYLVLVLTDERKVVAFLAILLASFLMNLGFNPHSFETTNLGLSFLDAGLSWVALVMGALIGSSTAELKLTPKASDYQTKNRIKVPYLSSATRGSILGFFIGFVPGLSYILSAMLSYSAERRYMRFKKLSQGEVTLRSIVASEAAQSSGTVSMLIPLLVFGIPITVSEGIILNVITINTDLKSVVTVLKENFLSIAWILVGVNVLSFYLALKSRVFIKTLFKIPSQVLQYVLIGFGCIAVVSSSEYYLVSALLTYGITYLAFNKLRINPLPFVMAVLLFNTTQSSFYLFWELR